MTTITNFMRMTKPLKAHDKKSARSPVVKKQRLSKHEVISSPIEVARSDEKSDVYIPTFIYETVKYKREHETHHVPKEMQTIVAYIKKYYIVPKDFEINKKFGCHSGLTYETRLARAYEMGHLSLKRFNKGQLIRNPICLTCATVGHTRKTCPNGF